MSMVSTRTVRVARSHKANPSAMPEMSGCTGLKESHASSEAGFTTCMLRLHVTPTRTHRPNTGRSLHRSSWMTMAPSLTSCRRTQVPRVAIASAFVVRTACAATSNVPGLSLADPTPCFMHGCPAGAAPLLGACAAGYFTSRRV